MQVQLLLLKLIEIAITEASFLLPANKNIKSEKFDRIYESHLRREIIHVLFSQGANATIDRIK